MPGHGQFEVKSSRRLAALPGPIAPELTHGTLTNTKQAYSLSRVHPDVAALGSGLDKGRSEQE